MAMSSAISSERRFEPDIKPVNQAVSRRDVLKFLGLGAGAVVMEAARRTPVAQAAEYLFPVPAVPDEQQNRQRGGKVDTLPASDRFIPPEQEAIPTPFSFEEFQKIAFRGLGKDCKRRRIDFDPEKAKADIAHSFGEVRAGDIVNFSTIIYSLSQRTDLSDHLKRVAEIEVDENFEYRDLGEAPDHYPWVLNETGWGRFKGNGEVTGLNLALLFSLAACESALFSPEVAEEDFTGYLKNKVQYSPDFTNAHGGANALSLLFGRNLGAKCFPYRREELPERYRDTIMTRFDDIRIPSTDEYSAICDDWRYSHGQIKPDELISRRKVLKRSQEEVAEADSTDRVVYRATAMMTCFTLWLRTASSKKEVFPFKDKEMEKPDMAIIGQFPGTDRSTPEKAQALDNWHKNFNYCYGNLADWAKRNPAFGFVVHGNLLDKEDWK